MPSKRNLGAPVEVTKSVTQVLQVITQVFLATTKNIFIKIATLPYYRLYHFNTIGPLKKLARLASNPSDTRKLYRTLSSWRERKLRELQFTTISCTVLAAAVIGAFSWTSVADAYWLTHGFWHMSLILAILGILLSASEVAVLDLLGPLPPLLPPLSSSSASPTPPPLPTHHFFPPSSSFIDTMLARYHPLLFSPAPHVQSSSYVPRRKMVFTWQAPLMFMSYSVCAFLAGLSILACSPLIRGEREWGSGHNIAVMYLTALVGGVTVFVFCSFWVYHYVDIEHDGYDGDEDQGVGTLRVFSVG